MVDNNKHSASQPNEKMKTIGDAITGKGIERETVVLDKGCSRRGWVFPTY